MANNQSFSSLRKKLQNFNSELEEIKTSMLNKKSLNWEDKARCKTFLKSRRRCKRTRKVEESTTKRIFRKPNRKK